MEESSTYQYLLQKGGVQELRRIVLLLGEDRFGPADAQVTTALEAINDVQQLENLALRLLKVGSWQELLEQAAPRTRRRRKRT